MNFHEAHVAANKILQRKIDNALTADVFFEVAKKEAAVIRDIVYGAYDPAMYDRRGSNSGGIGDETNIEIVGGKAINGRLEVVNLTEPNPGGCPSGFCTTGKFLPALIEYGDGYKGYRYDYYDPSNKHHTFGLPRPFTKKTIESLREGKEHVRGMRDGLTRQKVKVL